MFSPQFVLVLRCPLWDFFTKSPLSRAASVAWLSKALLAFIAQFQVTNWLLVYFSPQVDCLPSPLRSGTVLLQVHFTVLHVALLRSPNTVWIELDFSVQHK